MTICLKPRRPHLRPTARKNEQGLVFFVDRSACARLRPCEACDALAAGRGVMETDMPHRMWGRVRQRGSARRNRAFALPKGKKYREVFFALNKDKGVYCGR